MGAKSKIEWTDATWNPWQGCHKISIGCKNCYMFREKQLWGQDPERVVRSADKTFYAPLRWKEPRIIFTCSWSDFFIEDADPWRDDAWDIIGKTSHHIYLILTKRPGNVWDRWPWSFGHVWLGVSVEQQVYENRLKPLRHIPGNQFISAEPLLGPIIFSPFVLASGRIKWIITGGESGPDARPMKPEWALSIRDQCKRAGILFFHKQNGGNKKIDGVWGGCELDGKVYHEMPEGLRPALRRRADYLVGGK